MTAGQRQLTCREVIDFLGAYFAGELASHQRGAFDAHLARCRDCRTYLGQYEATMLLAKQASADAVDAGVPEDLVAAIVAAQSSDAPRIK